MTTKGEETMPKREVKFTHRFNGFNSLNPSSRHPLTGIKCHIDGRDDTPGYDTSVIVTRSDLEAAGLYSRGDDPVTVFMANNGFLSFDYGHISAHHSELELIP